MATYISETEVPAADLHHVMGLIRWSSVPVDGFENGYKVSGFRFRWLVSVDASKGCRGVNLPQEQHEVAATARSDGCPQHRRGVHRSAP